MNILRFLPFLGVIIAMQLSMAGAYLSGTRHLWFSTTVCLAVFIALCIHLYRLQARPLKNILEFIMRKYTGGQKELPYLGRNNAATMHDLENAFDRMFSEYNRKMFDEATRLKQYEVLLENIDTGVLSCSTDGLIYRKNREAERLLGPCDRLPEGWLAQKPAHCGVFQINRHGIPRDVLFSTTRFTQGDQTRLLCTLKDIRHILEEQQIESWKILTRVLTHEIMNSIAPILSLSETLATRSDDMKPDAQSFSTMKQAMQTIHRRSKGLLDFVENYRKLTRLPAPQYTDISADELFNDLQKLFNRPDITFDQPYPEFAFQADRGQIEQVLINLIKNAIEASAASEKGIQVSLLRDVTEDEVVIKVQDHGQGIAADAQERLFVPFYTTKPNGSGIGLNLCKQIVNAHKGHITVHSVAGKGSCFSISIPRKKATEKPERVTSKPSAAPLQA